MRENGNIEVQLPRDQEGMLSCARVGSMMQGKFVLEQEYQSSKINLNELTTAAQLSAAANRLVSYEKDGILVNIENDGSTLLADLETGVYLIRGYQMKTQTMQPTLVFIPTWNETKGEMLYDVTVVPKLETPVKTGDSGPGSVGILFAANVFLITFVLFWKKRLRKRANCDTMQ